MKKEQWGPVIWQMLHALGAKYTPDKQAAFKDLFNNIVQLLPCPKCTAHATEYIAKNNFAGAFESADSLFNWLFAFHNAVNARLGKATAAPATHLPVNYTKAQIEAGNGLLVAHGSSNRKYRHIMAQYNAAYATVCGTIT